MNPLRRLRHHKRRVHPSYRPTLTELEPRLVMAVNVLTYHNDTSLTGQNLNETTLTPANVNATDFGKLFTDTVDGAMYAQPLYLSNVAVPGMGTLNLVFAATENDSVYAFNADAPGAPIWQDSFTNPAAGVTAVSDADLDANSIAPVVGITGTPVIDPATDTLYVVAFTKEVVASTTSFVQRLHALDVTTGAEKSGGPVVIQASVPGTGQGSVNGMVSFNTIQENQRPGLLLDNGVVYIAWASFEDHTPYHGWVIGYNAQTLQQVAVFNDTPDGGMGGIWESGASPAADAAGNLYVVTAGGTFDANSSTTPNDDHGESVLKLSPTGANGLTVADSFTPFNQATLVQRDEDIASGGVLLLPTQPGPNPDEMIAAGKEGRIYLINRDDMGGFNPAVDDVIQELPPVITSLFGTPAYFNGEVYIGGVGNVLQAFSLTNGLLSTSAVSASSEAFGYPGTTPSVSANGSADGIVWAVEKNSTAILHAYDANNLGNELYNSGQAINGRDALDAAVKFEVPTIANGHVYVGTQTGLTVFGLLPPGSPSPFGTNGAFVTQAYEDLLGRAPDPNGLAYWSEQLIQASMTRTQVATGIEGSLEYLTVEVQELYGEYLHRTAEQAAVTTWTTFLRSGGSVEQLSAMIVGSNEYFNAHGGTAAGFLVAVYQDVLGRAVDPAGQATFGPELARGSSPGQVAEQIFSSPEHLQDVVKGFYQHFLHRSADAGGLATWANDLEQGMTDAQVIAFFVGSQEYFDNL
jgi:Domain of unknown function (DUF4214)